MRLPGFTADDSLRKSSEPYHAIVTAAGSTSGGQILPQQNTTFCFDAPGGGHKICCIPGVGCRAYPLRPVLE